MTFPAPDIGVARFPGPDAESARFPGPDRGSAAFPPAPSPVVYSDSESVLEFVAATGAVNTPFYLTSTALDVLSTATVHPSIAVATASILDMTSVAIPIYETVTSRSTLDINSTTTTIPVAVIDSGSTLDVNPSTTVKPAGIVSSSSTLDLASSVEVLPGVPLVGTTVLDINSTAMQAPVAAITSESILDFNSEGLIELPKVTWFDDFNRASLGSNWGVYSPLPTISGSTKMQAGAASSGTPSIVCLPMYVQPLVSDRQSVKIKLAAPTGTLDTAGNAVVGAYLRATGTANSGTMVAFQAYGTKCDLLSRSGSTWTQRATATITSLAAANEFELTADGNVYTVLRNGVAIPGCTWTDSGGLMTVGSSNRRWGAFLMSAYVSFQVRYSMAIDEITGKDI